MTARIQRDAPRTYFSFFTPDLLEQERSYNPFPLKTGMKRSLSKKKKSLELKAGAKEKKKKIERDVQKLFKYNRQTRSNTPLF